MFTKQQVVLLEAALDTHLAVVTRRYKAESHDGIRHFHGETISQIQALKLVVNDPALLMKGSK